MSEQGKGPELDIADKIKIAIEHCLMQYMTKQECLNSVSEKFGFHPSAVECVWGRLRIENPDFFNTYYRRMELTKQIVKFNHLLSQQVELMRASSYNGSHPSSSGQYISAPSALPTANTHYDYAQVSPNLLMSQHGNESMFHPSSCCCAAAPGSLFHPSTGVPNGYTRVSPNTVLPHNQNGSLFQPSAGVAYNGYAQYAPNMSISPDTDGSLIGPSMAGACNGYVQASQYTNNGSFVPPSLTGGDFNGSVQISPTLLTSQNGNMVLNSQLWTERGVYDDDRSTLRFIPTPQTRDATTSTSFIHGDRFGHRVERGRTGRQIQKSVNTRTRGEANNFTNGYLNTPGSSTGSVD